MTRYGVIPVPALMAAVMAAASPASAQDKGSVNPKPLPPLANPNDPNTPAKDLFGRKPRPAALAPQPIGFYARGCIAGAVALPINGPAWQVMRLSRNRNWGHPDLIALLERVAAKAQKTAGWPGLLVGDMSQPRGGPMLTGHASHQIGLDADIWLTPMPNRQLSREEREETSAVMMVRKDRLDIDPATWTPTHLPVIAPRHRSRKWSAFSSMPRSRKHCAGKRRATGAGCRKSARCTGTIIIFISA
jgi:penicillin-insensitive murein endopeptidase